MDKDKFADAVWEEFKSFSTGTCIAGEADWCAICRKLILDVQSWETLIKDDKQINFHVDCVDSFERKYLKEKKESSKKHE